MQNFLKIIVPGEPQGKQAARGFRGFIYTPVATKKYMAQIKEAAIAIGAEPRGNPCTMYIEAFCSIPKTFPKWKRWAAVAGLFIHVNKPDTDNISKIKDALTGVAFVDDKQVYLETIHRCYAEEPRLEISISYQEQYTRPARTAIGSLEVPIQSAVR